MCQPIGSVSLVKYACGYIHLIECGWLCVLAQTHLRVCVITLGGVNLTYGKGEHGERVCVREREREREREGVPKRKRESERARERERERERKKERKKLGNSQT